RASERERLALLLRLGAQQREVGERREAGGGALRELAGGERVEVLGRGRRVERVGGEFRLHDHLAAPLPAAGAPRDLDEAREEALRGAKVGAEERAVRA